MISMIENVIEPVKRVPADQTYLQMIRKIAGHFLGINPLTEGDLLYYVAEELPTQEMETRVVFLARPFSNWVKHVILLDKSKNDTILVDKNIFLQTDWSATEGATSVEDWVYKAIMSNGKELLLVPVFVTTIREIIENCSLRYVVKRKAQIKLLEKTKEATL